MKIKKFISVLLSIIFVLGILPIISYAQIESDFITIDFSNKREGNIYFGDERPELLIGVKNKSTQNATLSVNMIAEPKTEGIGYRYSNTEDILVLAQSYQESSVELGKNIKNGIYTLTVSITYRGEKIKTQELEFSIARKANKRFSDISVQTHLDGHTYESVSATNYITENVGFYGVRDENRWEFAEQNKGVLKVPAKREKTLNANIEAGNDIIMILNSGNSLYEVNNDTKVVSFPTTDEAIAGYVEYCKFMALTYKGKIDKFEIWNEPNTPNFTGGTVVNPSDYAKVLKAVYPAIKEVNPEATVIAGGLTSIQNKRFNAGIQAGDKYPKFYYYDDYYPKGIKIYDTYYWFKMLIEETDAAEYMDAFSFHPYHNSDLYSDEKEVTFRKTISYATDVFKAAGKENMPLYLTEYGKQSTKIIEGKATEEQQANSLIRTLVAAKSIPQIQNINLYCLREKNSEADTGLSYGLVTGEYRAKPALLAVANLNCILGDAECVEYYIEDSWNTIDYSNVSAGNKRGINTYRFKYTGNISCEDIFVVWKHTGNQSTTITIKEADVSEVTYSEDEAKCNGVILVPAGYELEVFDLYGNTKYVASGSKFTLSEQPMYIRCFESENEFINISRDGKEVKITGTAGGKNTEVSVVIKATGSNDILYLDQTTTDRNGGFKFNCEIPQNGFYYVYVFDGNKINESANIYDFLFNATAEVYINDVKTKEADINKLKAGDNVKIILTTEEQIENLMLLGALYGENGVMQSADIKQNGNTYELGMEIENPDKNKSLKFFIWEKFNLKPFALPIEFN